jgi:hypothetical protein
MLLRWTSADPLYRMLPEHGAATPQRGNWYTFTVDNPVRYVDPDGRQVYCPDCVGQTEVIPVQGTAPSAGGPAPDANPGPGPANQFDKQRADEYIARAIRISRITAIAVARGIARERAREKRRLQQNTSYVSAAGEDLHFADVGDEATEKYDHIIEALKKIAEVGDAWGDAKEQKEHMMLKAGTRTWGNMGDGEVEIDFLEPMVQTGSPPPPQPLDLPDIPEGEMWMWEDVEAP